MLALHDGKPLEALSIARGMQKRNPKDALGYAVEGDIEASRKNWVAAAAAYRTTLQHSNASEAAMKLHTTLRAAKKPGDADRVASDWLKERPNDPVFHFYLGDLATQQRDYAGAEAHYRIVLASQPGNAMAMNNVAWLLLEQSKPGALAMAERANGAMPNRAPVLDTLASVQAAEGQLAEAIRTQHRAIAAAPQDPGLRLKLARYLIKAGANDQGRDQLRNLKRLGDKFHGQAEVDILLKSM